MSNTTPVAQQVVRAAMSTYETTTKHVYCRKAGNVGGPEVYELPAGSMWRCRVKSAAADKTDKLVWWIFLGTGVASVADFTLPSVNEIKTTDFSAADQEFYICVVGSQRRVVSFMWDGAADTTILMSRLDKQDVG